MNLGNRLAVGEVVDHGSAEPPVPAEVTPEAATVRVEAPAEPVSAHAEP
ncbi:MAG: hypothetical protein M3Z25_12525 [Actinomycetota bacterium]|nr:hypothetical protein [Actinomycetota bacterium]